jgi:threonine dehydratase
VTRQVRRPTPDDVAAAWEVIRPALTPTPVDATAGPSLLLKLESLQPTGSFKVRGALNALAAVGPEVRVVAASAGNHGLGVAYASALLGRHATVVVPENASRAKIAALGEFPVRLERAGQSYDEAEAYALELAADDGNYFLSGYNDPFVIGGQGTIGCELAGQVDGEVTVVCGAGGGGLASGLGLWASGAGSGGARVVAVETEESTALSVAVRAGGVVPVTVGATLADGLAGNLEPGSVTVDVVRDHVAALITVTEGEIASAIRYLISAHGIVAEGSGAAPVAAVLAGKVPGDGGPVVAVISGRNITAETLASILAPPR